jgi:hypothetical protein
MKKKIKKIFFDEDQKSPAKAGLFHVEVKKKQLKDYLNDFPIISGIQSLSSQ